MIRKAIRDQVCEQRRCDRFKVVSSRRLLPEENHITVSQVQALAETIKKQGKIADLKQLKRALLLGEDFISAFLSVNGALASLISLLLGKNTHTTVEVCKCLTNLATGNHKAAFAVTKTAAPYLITFLQGNVVMVQNHSAWALANMAADCDTCRTRLKAQGIVPALLKLLSNRDRSTLESCTFALSVYTKFEADCNKFLCEEGVLKILLSLIDDPGISESTLLNSFCILFHLTSQVNETAEFFLQSGMAKKIVQVFICQCSLTPSNVLFVTPLLRCIGNMCAGPSDLVLEICSDSKLVECSVQLLYSSHLHLRKETLWLLGNLASSHSSQLNDLSAVLSHMGEVQSINMQESIALEVDTFISIARKRFKDQGVDSIFPEVKSPLYNKKEAISKHVSAENEGVVKNQMADCNLSKDKKK